MRLVVNGEEMLLDENNLTVIDLLKTCKVEMPDTVSVQVNGEFVSRPDFGSVVVKHDDEVDFLYFMGGGSR